MIGEAVSSCELQTRANGRERPEVPGQERQPGTKGRDGRAFAE